MKNALMILLAGAMLSLVGCSKKDSGNPITPGNPAAPPAANITFTMGLQSGSQGMIIVATPNVDVKLTKIELSFPAQQFNDVVNNPQPDTVFPKGTRFEIGEYTGIDGGQRWVLKFTGTEVASGKPFTVTVNWTVV
jgi:hypothetical protein